MSGEQPNPVANDNPPTWNLVIRDLEVNNAILVIEDARARDAVGRERYGVPLQPGNERDSLRDAYEEALDLMVYLKNCRVEREMRLARFPLDDKLYQTALLLCVRIRDQLYQRDGR